MRAGLSQGELDKLLKLKIVCVEPIYMTSCIERQLSVRQQTRERTKPSFKTKYSFFSKIDKLPSGSKWTVKTIRLTGDKLDEQNQPIIEDVELWMRDPVECAAELLDNPAFKGKMKFAAEWMFDADGNRIINEMWTADWWAEIEVSGVLCSSVCG